MMRLLSKRKKKTLKRKTQEHLLPKRYHELNKQLTVFKYFIHKIIFIFVVLIFHKKIHLSCLL